MPGIRKIAINTTAGGFHLPSLIYDEYLRLSGKREEDTYDYEIPRDDESMIAAIEKFGLKASRQSGVELKIVEIPNDVEWEIQSNDLGIEWIAEKHRTWK